MSSKTQLISKWFVDILLSLIGLILLAFPFAIIALAIKLESKGSVFFRQERVGKDGRSFKVWKFRTMVEGAMWEGLSYNVAKDDSRITRVGAVLRNWGLVLLQLSVRWSFVNKVIESIEFEKFVGVIGLKSSAIRPEWSVGYYSRFKVLRSKCSYSMASSVGSEECLLDPKT